MKLFQRIFFAAVLSGLAAGLAMSALQQWKVAPLIAEAELYETAEMVVAPLDHDAAVAAHDHDEVVSAAAGATEAATPAHSHDEAVWAPADGIERISFTVLANILAALGFALLLASLSVLTGIEVTAANGLIWGLGGFVAVQLAPAFGLPPELPGMPAADLASRQIWWWGTALATGAAFVGIAKFRSWPAIAIGAGLILVPHIIGAPPLPDEASAVPARLATSFAASALGASAAFWLTLGPLYGWLNSRFAEAEIAVAAKGAPA